MGDLLLVAVQLVCVIGLGYGFILTMIHADCVDTIGSRRDLVSRTDGFEIKLVRDDSARRGGAAAEHGSLGQRSRTATDVD